MDESLGQKTQSEEQNGGRLASYPFGPVLDQR
jgi:hypothetical protein